MGTTFALGLVFGFGLRAYISRRRRRRWSRYQDLALHESPLLAPLSKAKEKAPANQER